MKGWKLSQNHRSNECFESRHMWLQISQEEIFSCFTFFCLCSIDWGNLPITEFNTWLRWIFNFLVRVSGNYWMGYFILLIEKYNTNTENHTEQMYGLIHHYTANTSVTRTQFKKRNFTHYFRSPTLCFVANQPSLPPLQNNN